MKKSAILIIGLISSFFITSHKINAQVTLPEVVPPSPSVAGLMKFEEMPVSNYTGIPDISIPVYNMSTMSKDISINVSLNYHPSDIQVSSIATCTGVGWNLFVGGSISRTVRGLPDEITIGKDGVYDPQNNFLNFFYNNNNNFLMPAPFTEEHQSFYWDTYEKGLYDTEYDLYQYNFMGYSGRFFIRKNKQNAVLDVVLLRLNALKFSDQPCFKLLIYRVLSLFF